MGKHAYLVIAHRYDELFKTLMKMLDYPENDIFVHMDIKCEDYNPEENASTLKHSGLYHVKRLNVGWGSFAMAKAELLLLERAIQTDCYEYYHLISGQDLPIISQEDIHLRLSDDNREYVEIIADKILNPERIYYFHFPYKKGTLKEYREFDNKFCNLQQKCGIKINKNLNARKGSQWFSITDDLARYIVSKKKMIYRSFRFSLIPDESFVQTLIWNSPFKKRLFKDPQGRLISVNKREIDWMNCKEGHPGVYTMNELETLINSDNYFARKFDPNTDINVIEKIYETYKEKG